MPRHGMRQHALAVLVLFFLTGCGKAAPTQPESEGTGAEGADIMAKVEGEPFDDAQIFFEFNTSDNDLGLQIFLDHDGWQKVQVTDPGNQPIVQIMPHGELAKLGITELRFESAEPSPPEVLAAFGPGTYTFIGKTVEGEHLLSTPTLSHDFLPAPTLTPSSGEEVDPDNLTVTWNAPGAALVQIIIENEDLGHFFDVILPGAIGSLDVPPQFLQDGTEYAIEILAMHANGNRTIVEGDFVTE